MADEKVRKVAEEAFNRLAAELEAGKSDALRNYLATMGRFHRYSWGNVLLIGTQRPTATRVAGYHTWRDLGRHVKTGEKGIMIFAPILTKERETPPKPPSPDQSATKKNDIFRVAGFRTAFVFDVEQTEGKELPQFAKTTGDPKEFADKLKALVAKQGISLEYDKSIAPAYGVSYGEKIRIIPGMQPAEEFSVLAHELAHEMLHHGKDEPRLPKIVRETQAEAVAYVVSRGVGLETNSAAADYIALYTGDKKTLAESLSVIQDTSSRILDELLPREPRSPFHERQAERDLPNGSSPTHEEPGRPGLAPGASTPQMPDAIDSISFGR
jgi:N-terminal domain of anti-restriction factor ArdC